MTVRPKKTSSLDFELAELHVGAVAKFWRSKATSSALLKMKKRTQKSYTWVLREGGGIFLRRDRTRKLIAAVLFRKNDQGHYRLAARWRIEILSRPGDKKSLLWAKGLLTEQHTIFARSCVCQLEAWQLDLLPWFEQKQIRVRSVLLGGEVQKSLRRLRSHYGNNLNKPFARAGLVFRPARTKAELKSYLGILRKEYGRNPQFGPYVANEKFLGQMRKGLWQDIAGGRKPLWLLYKQDQLLGGADILELAPDLEGKTRAGFGVNLAAFVQGRGLARSIYEKVLEELNSRNIASYSGSTGQPGVMRLGQIMGRKLVAVEVDRGVTKAFPRKNFRGWI